MKHPEKSFWISDSTLVYDLATSSPYHSKPSLFVFLESLTLGLAMISAAHHPLKSEFIFYLLGVPTLCQRKANLDGERVFFW